MGKIITTLINRFDGGISNDLRAGWSGSNGFFTTNKFSLTKNFDALTFPNKLRPHRSTEVDETGATGVVAFLYARTTTATAYLVYGLGTDGATTKPCLYLYDIDGGFASGWSGGAYFKSANTGRDNQVLFYYKNYIYVYTTNKLERCDITTSTNNFADFQTLTAHGYVAQPVHSLDDDNAYFFVGNVVYQLTGADAWTTKLTLNADLNIMAACEWNKYLAIACVTKGTSDYHSYVYLWDKSSATWNDMIDFGRGKIQHLANLDNKLIGVMDYYISGSNGMGGRGKIIVKQAVGQFGMTVNELLVDTSGGTAGLPPIRHIKDNKLYFVAKAKLNGDYRYGIWVVDSAGRLSLDYVEEGVTEASGNYNGIFSIGNIWFIAHSDDGSINRTNDNEVGLFTSVYESLIFNAGDSSITKQLEDIRLMTESLVANDSLSVVVKYRKDSDIDGGSWITILTRTTANANEILHEANNIESSGAVFPQFKEIQFRIEILSGAEAPAMTGLEFHCEIIDKNKFTP